VEDTVNPGVNMVFPCNEIKKSAWEVLQNFDHALILNRLRFAEGSAEYRENYLHKRRERRRTGVRAEEPARKRPVPAMRHSVE